MMKKTLLFLLLFIPFVTVCGQVTEAQKKEALTSITRFCTLMSQFSSGGAAYLTNDHKIFDICSSPKISTYDDIGTEKEVMLNLYLAQITMKYKNKLSIEFTSPKIDRICYIPLFDIQMQYNDSENSGIGFMATELKKKGFSDIYIVANTTQTTPTLNKTTKRKIIYSVAEQKIISFSNSNSPFTTFCDALVDCSEKNYQSALDLCNKVFANERFDKKSACLGVILMICTQLNDFNTLMKYKDYFPVELKDAFNTAAQFYEAFNSGDYKKALSYALILAESKISTRHYMQLYIASSYAEGIGCEKNKEKANYWIKRSISEGSPAAGYEYVLFAMNDETGIDLSGTECIEYLTSSAERFYTPAYTLLAYMQYCNGDNSEAEKWYIKSVENNDVIGMINYGLFCYQVKKDKKKALYWLQKAINDTRLETYLNNCQYQRNGASTKSEIEQVIRDIENNVPIDI